MNISNLRFSGMASGMDTENMVKQLMQAERMPLEKLEQQKIGLEWKRDAYRETNTSLLNLRNKAFDMKLNNTYKAKEATSSNDSVAKVTAQNGATEGIHKVEVKNIAKGVFAASQNQMNSTKNSSETLATQLGASGTVEFSLNGKNFSFDSGTNSLDDVLKSINDSNLGVKASYDSNLDRVFFNSTETGSSSKLDIVEGAGNLFSQHLQMDMSADGTNDNELHLSGEDANIVYNGVSISNAENQLSVNGLNLNLQDVGTVNVNVSNNVDEVFNKVKDFVTEYNKVLEGLNGKLSENRNRDYKPLTESQKEEMSDKQIELWEEKSKSGLLNGDPILRSTVTNLRQAMSSVVGGLPEEANTMFDIGLSTGNYKERGKIVIDEDKLKKAIADNPEKVMNLFTQDSQDPTKQGLAQRLHTTLDNSMDRISNKAGGVKSFGSSSISSKLSQIDNEREDFTRRLSEVEERYWKQFTAMEKALQKMNSQSSWMMQQFGGF